MKSVKNLSLGIVLATLLATNVQASGVGNGGYSVVCRDRVTNRITSAEVLDIFEGRNLYYLEYSNNPVLKHEDYLASAVGFLKTLNGVFASSVEAELKGIEAKILYIPDSLVLEPTNDAFPTLGRKDCKFEQLATYTDDDKLYVSNEIYSALDELNKAALRLHEATYILARKAGEKDSKSTRVITSGSLALAPANRELIAAKVKAITEKLPGNAAVLKCGDTGTLEQRIADCKETITTPSGYQWVIVQRDDRQISYYNLFHKHRVYKAPDGTLVSSVWFDLKGPGASSRGNRKKTANTILEQLKEKNLCNTTTAYSYFRGYSSSIKDLSLNLRTANFNEQKELLQKYEGSAVIGYQNEEFLMSNETFTGSPDELFDFFFDGRGSKSLPKKNLKTYNPISHRIALNRADARDLRILCIE